MLIMSVVLGTFAHPELLLRVKGCSSWILLGSAGIVLTGVLYSETWSWAVSASSQSRALAGAHQRPNQARVLHGNPFWLVAHTYL